MSYNDLDIIIKPRLNEQILLQVIQTRGLDGSVIAELINDLFINIKERIDIYLMEISETLQTGKWKQRLLRRGGEEILYISRSNVSSGYGNSNLAWEQRAEVTQELYALRRLTLFSRERAQGDLYNPNAEGMTTGKDVLLNSLMPGEKFNIYEIHPFKGLGEYGTKFKYARSLENGFFEFPDDPIMGFKPDGTPKKWLLDGIRIRDFSNDPNVPDDVLYKTAKRIYDKVMGHRSMPARPFLKPALWQFIDEESHRKIGSEELVESLQITLRRTPAGSKDKIEVINHNESFD